MNNKTKRVKIKKATALKYDKNINNAPKVVASGKGDLAAKILEIAKEQNIAVYKDEALVEALINVEVGQEIPPELYKAMAEILAFVYKLDLLEKEN
mgnify:CR=1 FL=1